MSKKATAYFMTDRPETGGQRMIDMLNKACDLLVKLHDGPAQLVNNPILKPTMEAAYRDEARNKTPERLATGKFMRVTIEEVDPAEVPDFGS